MSRSAPRALALVLGCAALLGLATRSAPAQAPDGYENLQVLPEDIPRDSLTRIMRGFTQSLGVRCSHCHVQQEVDGRRQFVYAADDRPAKRKARFMMQMVRELNGTTLAALPDRSAPPVAVTCATCHRGLALPRPLEAHLADVITAGGVDSAVAEYRRLRTEVAHLGQYNFGEFTLNDLAETLGEQGRTAEAIALLELNGEFYPGSAGIDVQLAELHLARGERDRAVTRLRMALTKQPNNRAAQARLRELTGAPPA